MAAIVKELTLAASPEKVYNALTQPEEIARWWTEDLSVQPKVGLFAERNFVVHVGIAERASNKKVCWIAEQGQGFEGTTITWQLTPVESGTNLVFTLDFS